MMDYCHFKSVQLRVLQTSQGLQQRVIERNNKSILQTTVHRKSCYALKYAWKEVSRFKKNVSLGAGRIKRHPLGNIRSML